MSGVANIILCLSWADENAIEPLQKYLVDHHHGTKLRRVERYAGGHKGFEAVIYMGAFKQPNQTELETALRECPLRFPDVAQLFMKEQEDDVFRAVHWVKRP